MADQVYVLIQAHTLTTLQADETLAADVKTFARGLAKRPEDYNENELPLVFVEIGGSSGGEASVAIGGLEEVHYDLTVGFIAQSAGADQRDQTVKNLAGRAETVMRKQYGDYQMSDLDEAVPNAEPGSVVTVWQGTNFGDNGIDGGQYRALAEANFDLQIDINVED